MRVLFINCVCSNGGDAAILEAACAIVRRAFGPDTEILVQDDHPHRTRKLYPHLKVVESCYWHLAYTKYQGWRGRLAYRLRSARFAISRWLIRHGARSMVKHLVSTKELEYLDTYASADIVIATGGTYLVDNYDLDQRAFDMLTAIGLNRPLVLFTQSIGPLKTSRHRRRFGHVFRAASLILLRDERSAAYIYDFKLAESRIRRAPDAAFAFADSDLANRSIAPFPLEKARPRVCISVRDWPYFSSGTHKQGMARYCDAIASLTVHLVRAHNAHITFLSTCQGVSDYHDDSLVACTIQASLPEDIRWRVDVDCAFHTPQELIEWLRTVDWVVTTRMHLAILALDVGAPVLPIAYEFKTLELFESLGYELEIPSIETLTSEGLIAAFEDSVRTYAITAPRIRAAVERCRRQAWQVGELLHQLFPSYAPRSRLSVTQMYDEQSLPVKAVRPIP